MYDMNIPLTTSATSDSSSSSSSSKRHKRRQLAHSCQLRLRELGYRGLAFTHTAYTGRLHGTRDDADIALPWDDLLFPPPPHRSSKDTTTTAARTAFGRMDERTGMRIYRRLNIIIEESGDISRLLLHDSSSSSATNAAGTTANITTTTTTSVQQILQKYDIVSIQPMNELVMQSICDLLGNSYTTRHDQFRQLHDRKERMNEFSNNNNNNNIHYIDIIVLEYATGSKGGYGLPYKLRKEYMQRILPLQSNDNNNHNIIFEINYATAMMDSKRRQGFIRTLLDLHIGYDSIQKKSHHHARHRLLFSNNSNNDKTKHDNKRGGNRSKTRGAGIHITTTTTTTTKTKRKCFPCIISSGSRQDYTNGSDEGLLTFRTPNDINHYIQNLVGNSNNNSGTKVGGEGGVIGSASVERMLTHAYNRAMGVAAITTSSTNNKRLRGETTRSYVVVDRCDTVTTASAAVANNDIDDEDDEDDEEGGNNGTNASSLIDWLSSSMPPPCKRTRKDTMDVITTSTTPQSNRSMSNNDDGIIIPYHAIKPTSLSDDAIQHQLTISEPGNEQEESVVESSIGHVKDDDDIEDGYIAM